MDSLDEQLAELQLITKGDLKPNPNATQPNYTLEHFNSLNYKTNSAPGTLGKKVGPAVPPKPKKGPLHAQSTALNTSQPTYLTKHTTNQPGNVYSNISPQNLPIGVPKPYEKHSYNSEAVMQHNAPTYSNLTLGQTKNQDGLIYCNILHDNQASTYKRDTDTSLYSNVQIKPQVPSYYQNNSDDLPPPPLEISPDYVQCNVPPPFPPPPVPEDSSENELPPPPPMIKSNGGGYPQKSVSPTLNTYSVSPVQYTSLNYPQKSISPNSTCFYPESEYTNTAISSVSNHAEPQAPPNYNKSDVYANSTKFDQNSSHTYENTAMQQQMPSSGRLSSASNYSNSTSTYENQQTLPSFQPSGRMSSASEYANQQLPVSATGYSPHSYSPSGNSVYAALRRPPSQTEFPENDLPPPPPIMGGTTPLKTTHSYVGSGEKMRPANLPPIITTNENADDLPPPPSPVSSSYSELRRATESTYPSDNPAMNYPVHGGYQQEFNPYAPGSQTSSNYESIYEPINPRPASQNSTRSSYSLYGGQSTSANHHAVPQVRGRGGAVPAKEAEVDALTDLLVQGMDDAEGEELYGICVKCNERIIGESNGCTAMEQVYHVDCFCCDQCGANLQGKPFYPLEGKPFCEEDYLNTLEKCSVCMKPILDRILRATGKPYHPKCFCCIVCGKSLDGIPFTVDATNQIHCIEDFHKKFAPRCCVCKLPIMPEPGQEETVRVVALDRSFHITCYKCEDCGLVLSSEAEGRGCYPLDDHVLCKSCNAKRVQALTSHMTTEL